MPHSISTEELNYKAPKSIAQPKPNDTYIIPLADRKFSLGDSNVDDSPFVEKKFSLVPFAKDESNKIDSNKTPTQLAQAEEEESEENYDEDFEPFETTTKNFL